MIGVFDHLKILGELLKRNPNNFCPRINLNGTCDNVEKITSKYKCDLRSIVKTRRCSFPYMKCPYNKMFIDYTLTASD
jgi:hypothetical protein